ncbi:hypothetical protein QJQ45_025281 [Haematococcus lacustris]|nr:hypothetical protein QJQ45_025281 [Haematococcus lacustris]
MLFSMAKKKRRTVPRPVPEDPDSDIEDRDEALQPDLTEAQQNRKASGEARAARDRDNTYHARKAKLAHLIDHLPQALWDAFLADAVQPRVEAISERGVLASLLFGLLVRGLFTIRVADPLGLHDQPVYTDIPVSQAAIPDLSCRNLFLQLVRGLPGNGANTQPNAAVAAVLAAHPDLRARLAAIPRHLSDSNMVDHVGKQLETAFSNILTLLFAGRLKKSVSLAGAKVLVGTEEHRRRFGFWGVEGGGHLPAWSKRECTYVRRLVCGLDVSWLLEQGGVVPTPAMQAEVALQRGLLGLEEGERVDDDWVEDPVNRGRLLRHAVHTTREMEAAMAAWQLDMVPWQQAELTNPGLLPRPPRPPTPYALTPTSKCRARHVFIDTKGLYGMMHDAGMLGVLTSDSFFKKAKLMLVTKGPGPSIGWLRGWSRLLLVPIVTYYAKNESLVLTEEGVTSLKKFRNGALPNPAVPGNFIAGPKDSHVSAPCSQVLAQSSLPDRPNPPTTPKTSDGHNAVPNELQEEPQREQHLRSAAFLPWQERRERSDAAARSNSEQRKREYVESAPQHQERLAAQMTALQSVFQTAISKDWQHHACVSGATRLEDSPLKPLQVMQVEYISMQDRFKVMLPCASRNQSISPNPLSFFCWPSSQTHAKTWYDVIVLRSYAHMQGCGVSMGAFLEALNAAHHPLALYPPKQIRTDSFSQAFFDYLRAIDRLLSMPSLLQQRSDLQAQLPRGAFSVPQDGYEHCVAGDACNKPSRYAGVAKATRDLEQHTDTYLDRTGLEGAVQQLHDSGHLSLSGAFAAARATTEATGAGADAAVVSARLAGVDSEAHDCSTLLPYFRPETSNITASQPCQPALQHNSQRGVVGFVCCHDVPLLALYCNMRTAEQFVYYLLAWHAACDMLHLYIDLACQFQVPYPGGAAHHSVHELGLQRDRMGQSDKDTRAASNAIKAKLRTARQLLKEAALYQALGSAALRLPPQPAAAQSLAPPALVALGVAPSPAASLRLPSPPAATQSQLPCACFVSPHKLMKCLGMCIWWLQVANRWDALLPDPRRQKLASPKHNFAQIVHTDGVAISVMFLRPKPAAPPAELPRMGRGVDAVNPLAHLHAEWLGVDPGKTNMATVAHEERSAAGTVVSVRHWKLTAGQYYRDSGITRQAQATKTWLAKVKPQLTALSRVSSKPSSLASYRRFANTVLATYDAMWAEVSKKRWANAKFRLYCGKMRVVASFWAKVKKQAQKRWPDRILALAYGAASFSGSGSIGCRGVPVSQMRKEAVKQFGAGRVVLVDEFRTSRVSSAYSHPSEALPGQPPESFRWLRPVYSEAKRSQVRGLMSSTSYNIRFYDRDVSAALNIRRCAVGPGPRPTELCYWDGRPAMPKPGRPGQEWVYLRDKALLQSDIRSEIKRCVKESCATEAVQHSVQPPLAAPWPSQDEVEHELNCHLGEEERAALEEWLYQEVVEQQMQEWALEMEAYQGAAQPGG